MVSKSSSGNSRKESRKMTIEEWQSVAKERILAMGYKKDDRYSCEALAVYSKGMNVISIYGGTIAFRTRKGNRLKRLFAKIKARIDCMRLRWKLG